MNPQPTPDPAADTDTADTLIPIDWKQGAAVCQMLGLEPSDVAEITIRPHWVFVTYRDGQRRHPLIYPDGTPPPAPTWVDTGSGPGHEPKRSAQEADQ